MRPAYYNECDPFAAAWLRELIADGLIAPGEVDERSIEDVRPDDVAGFAQCHFFAGIGIWSLALRQAGWPDDEPIWTGSCPCQPFSAAGKGTGFADERHLWPALHWLVLQRKPEFVIGEQVASKDGLAWLDLVQADLEAAGYTVGAVDTCAAGFGAPHIRQRLYWVADAAREDGGTRLRDREPAGLRLDALTGGSDVDDVADALSAGRAEGLGGPGSRSTAGSDRSRRLDDDDDARPQRHAGHGGGEERREASKRPAAEAGLSSGLADANGGDARAERLQLRREHGQRPEDGPAGRLADAGRARVRDNGPGADASSPRGVPGEGLQRQRLRDDARHDGGVGVERVADARGRQFQEPLRGPEERDGPAAALSGDRGPGPTNGYWRAADWLFCRDRKWRAVEPGTFPLVDGRTVRNRVGELRGAGNALNLAQAVGFIEAMMDLRASAGQPRSVTFE